MSRSVSDVLLLLTSILILISISISKLDLLIVVVLEGWEIVISVVASVVTDVRMDGEGGLKVRGFGDFWNIGEIIMEKVSTEVKVMRHLLLEDSHPPQHRVAEDLVLSVRLIHRRRLDFVLVHDLVFDDLG